MADSSGSPGVEKNNVVGGGSGFLTGSEIEARWEELFPASEEADMPPPVSDVNPASVDLHLGSEYFVTKSAQPERLTDESPYIVIPNGEFALLNTWEVVNVPSDLLAFITMRYRHKLKGLISISGFHVDPGFKGQLLYSVYNAGPSNLTLKFKEPVFSIFFATVFGATRDYVGDHQGQRGIPTDVVSALTGLPINLAKLSQRLDRLETTLYVVAAGATAVGIPIIVFILSEVF